MGEAKRRRQLDPQYGTVPAPLRSLLALLRSAYTNQYSKIGRNATWIDESEDKISFIDLESLIQQSLSSDSHLDSRLKEILPTLIELVQTYDPTKIAILLHLSWHFSEAKTRLTFQIRRLAFDGSTWHPDTIAPRQIDADAGSIEFMQVMSLAPSQVEHSIEFEFDNTHLRKQDSKK